MMGDIAFVAFTKTGCELALKLARALGEECYKTTVSGPQRFCDELGIEPYDDIQAWTKKRFFTADALVFIGALGIALREVAPYIEDKMHDPAVVQIDEAGRFAVPVLSGHVGGANELARRLSALCGAQAVISTATDINGVFAVDEWASKMGLALCEREYAKEVSATLLEGGTVGFKSDFDISGSLPQGLVQADDARDCPLGIHVTHDEASSPFARTLHLIVRDVVVGVGCRKGTTSEHLACQIDAVLAEHGISTRAVSALASIDVKSQETALHEYASKRDCDLVFFTAEELQGAKGNFEHSQFVADTVGVDNVCERAASLASDAGELICAKQAREGVTVALAKRRAAIAFEAGKAARLSVVGLGPGGADDMTLRARRALERADLIVGYTVYIDLLKKQFPNKKTFATPMRKEVERCRMALEQAQIGRTIVMVCSGDPGVYGMAGLIYELADEYPSVEIEVIPGVSAANGGAAVLGAALMHDFAVISLSDLLTSWEKIEKRLRLAGEGDFCICLYNPSSRKRPDYLQRACDILLEVKSPATVCGYVRNIGRENEECHVTTLDALRDTPVDMFTTVFIGNSETRVIDGRMVTPRGYLTRKP